MHDIRDRVRLYQGHDSNLSKLDQEIKRRIDLKEGGWTLTQRGFVASEKVSPQ